MFSLTFVAVDEFRWPAKVTGSVLTYVQKRLQKSRQAGGYGKRLIVEIDLEPLGRANHVCG